MARFKGAIFDLDGVVVSSVEAHKRAWKDIFDNFLKKYSSKQFKPFTNDDYLKYVDGKPRYEGVRSFLSSRGIELDFGSSKDPPEKETIKTLGDRKNLLYKEYIEKEKPFVYKPAVEFMRKLKRKKIKIALVSSSKNARLILNKTNLTKYFPVIVDGNTVERAGIRGKPSPDAFLYAAKKLELDEGECVVFEDAFSGIQAGASGNFGMVVGIKRGGQSLCDADKIIKNFRNFSIKNVESWFQNGLKKKNWKFECKNFSPENERTREALCTVGNGYMGVRGCFETQRESPNHYPGCYIAGVYNELVTNIKGKKARNNDLVNCPNWLLFELKIGKEGFADPFSMEIIDYEKSLDMKNAVLFHRIVFKDKKGRETKIESRRFASMHNPHLCSIDFDITPLNYSESIVVRSLIDGDVRNNNVARYSGLKSKHLEIIKKGAAKNGFFLHSRTNESRYEIVMAGKHFTSLKGNNVKNKKTIGEEFSFHGRKKKKYSIQKMISVFTSLDCTNPEKSAMELLDEIKDAGKVLKEHEKSWKKLWNEADIYLDGDRNSQMILRLHTYHLLATYSPHVLKLDVGISARGLHGESYHGHIFWDEVYSIPFYIHHFPEIAKASLLYRCRRLSAAKEYAEENGHKGAMYPWQSADSGKEETQTIHYNPQSRKWDPDFSRNQRHISIAVFYNFYKYMLHTKDKKFLYKDGIWTMVEIARFWADISSYNKREGKYHIKGVMGPDEFHEHYPGTKKALNDNTYTNVMVSWLFEKLLEIVRTLPVYLLERMNLEESELKKWEHISKNLYIPVKNGIMMQFEGFDRLKKIDFEHYRRKYGTIGRMDRILKKEEKSPNNYKVLKQADTLMIFYLLNLDEAVKILRRLGIRTGNKIEFLKKHYSFYSSLTTHGSSLSRFVHNAISLSLYKDPCIWDYFLDAMSVDVKDTQGGTTAEGIHCGMMSGTINFVRKYLCGIKTHEDGVTLKPYFPKHWEELKMRLHHQKMVYDFTFTPKKIEVALLTGKESHVHFGKKRINLKKEKKAVLRNPATFKKSKEGLCLS